MTLQEALTAYRQWIYDSMCQRFNGSLSWHKLFDLLWQTEFTWRVNPLDENRAVDGIQLRHRWCLETGERILEEMYSSPASVLETLVALAFRAEENIASDPEIGDRTSQWFWIMMVNLGLGSQPDDHFSMESAMTCINRFLDGQYEANGRGGLFMLRQHPEIDMRTLEIWAQLSLYFEEFL